jgi:hypothetical protein
MLETEQRTKSEFSRSPGCIFLGVNYTTIYNRLEDVYAIREHKMEPLCLVDIEQFQEIPKE